MKREIRNILIVKPSALGDILLALPALSALRRAYPDAQISWLVRSEYAGLLRGHPDLNEIILFDRVSLGKWWYNGQSFKALMMLFRQLREERFDAVFDFQGLFRSAILARITGARLRFGPAAAREGAAILYNRRIKQDSNCIHLVDYFLAMVKALTGSIAAPEFVLPHDERAAESAARLLEAKGLNQNGYAVLVPGSARESKCWPAQRFGALAERVAAEYDLRIVTVGSKGEQKLTQAVQTASSVPIIDVAGQTNIAELVAVLRNARLVISNDTGPGHIAAAAGVPVVLIFGPTNPARVCPYGRIEDVVAYDANSRGLKADSFDPAHAIERISVDDVWTKIGEVLARAATRSTSVRLENI